MNKYVMLVAATATVSLTVSACGSKEETTSRAVLTPDSVTVTTALAPLEAIARGVGGEHATVVNLSTGGNDPHTTELSAQSIKKVLDSDVFFYLGEGFQPAVEDLAHGDASAVAFDAATAADLHPVKELVADAPALNDDGEEHHADDEHADETDHADDEHADEADHGDDEHADDEHGHVHDPDSLDPHFWLDPVRVSMVADAFADHLTTIDPDHGDDYAKNAADLKATLNEIDADYRDSLAACKGKSLVTAHTSFGYLAHRYDLHQVGIAGLRPDQEPSGAQMAKLTKIIEDEQVTTIFTDETASDAVATSLATEAHATTSVLSPGGTTMNTIDAYTQTMTENLETLREGLGCS